MTQPVRYTLYGAPTRASLAPQIVLEEVGAGYREVRVDLDGDAHKTPEFLRLNPSGQIPVLVDRAAPSLGSDRDTGDLVIRESAAICLHLADQHPEAGLLPPPATAERARAYQTLLFLASTVQPTLMEYFYPERYAPDALAQVSARALNKLATMWQRLDGELRHDHVLASGFSICDATLYMLASWHRDPARPLSAYEHVWRVLRNIAMRPAVRRVAVVHRAGSTTWASAAAAMDPGLHES